MPNRINRHHRVVPARRWPGRPLSRLGAVLLAGLVCSSGGAPPNAYGQDSVETQTPDTSSAAIAQDSAGLAVEPTPVDEDQARTDADIQSDLQAALDRVPSLNGIRVTVEAGVVTLDGQVVSPGDGEQAAELARAFDGVLVVLNHVEQSSSLEERLEPTLARLKDFFLNALAQGPLLLVAFLIVGIAWVLGQGVRRIRLPSVVTQRNPFIEGLAQRFVQAAVLVGGVVVALQLLDAVALVGALAGTAGLAGLTLGFAFKDIVENYLAGLFLSLRHPFATGDHIVVDGEEGKVIRLTWRDTILMTLDGNHLRIPNARIFRSTVLNYTRNPKRRFSFDFGIGPADDLDEARSMGVATLQGMESVLDDPAPQGLALELGDSSVQMRFRGWVDQRERSIERVRSEALRLVKLALDDAGISLPSPEYRVIMAQEELDPESEDGATPSARPRSTESREEGDTGPDEPVDQQILEDEATSTEENLLDTGVPGSR